MNPRTTGMLALVALTLGAFVYFYEIGGETARKAASEAGERVFPGLEAEVIDVLSLTTQDGVEARFDRVDGVWQLVAPLAATADATALDAITAALANLSREGRVEAPEALHAYGLGDAARVVTFEVAGETFALEIGRATPVGGNRYVKVAGQDDVSYVATHRLNPLESELADLRDRRIFSFETATVTGISMAWPGVEIVLERIEGDWSMRSPAKGPADTAAVRDLLTDLSYLRAEAFIDAETEATRAAMDAVALDLVLSFDDDDRRITIGGLLGDETLVRGPSGRLFTIPNERLDDFERSISAYRFKTLSEFDVSAARRFELIFETQEQVVEVRLEGEGWRGGDPEIDPERASELVGELAQLHAESIAADAMGPDERAGVGLAPPRSSIRVYDALEGGNVLAEISIGQFDEERGIFAQRAGDSTIYLLDSQTAEALPVSWEAFNGHFLAGSEDESDDAVLPELESMPAELGEGALEGLEIP